MTTKGAPMGDVPSSLFPHGRIRRWWRNAPVRRKFLSVVYVSMLVCIPPILVALVLEVRLREVRSDTRATAEIVAHIEALRETLTEADTAVRYFAILGFDDVEHVDDFDAAAEAVPGRLAAIEDEVPADMAEPVRAVAAASTEQLEQLTTLVNYVPTMPVVDDPSDEAIVNEREPNLLDGLLAGTSAAEAAHDRIQRLSELVNQRLSQNRAEVDRIEGYLVWATLVSLAIALAAVAAGAVIVTAGIVGRIERLSENGRRFLRGEPLLPTGNARDEIGLLTNNIAYVGELLDERRREAVAATRAKDDFLWRISHELRTPLTAIIGFGQLLEEEDLSPENLDSAHHIVSAGHHLLALIDELLDIAKIEAGHLTVSAGPVVVEEVATETTALVRSMAVARSLVLTSDCPEDLVVTADRRRLAQVLINLLTNAIKYNSPSGNVLLAATLRGDTVRISVTDTGSGISPADLDLLFRPYERLDAAGSGIEGSGIGLALTKRLVEAMGGTIGVDTAVDQGTTFWVDLPRAPVVTEIEVPAPPATADTES
jgi:signal transduction histidine kinase